MSTNVGHWGLEVSAQSGAQYHRRAHGCPLRVLHVLTPPGGLHHLLLLLPDVGLQRALAVAATPRVVDDRGVPGNTGHTGSDANAHGEVSEDTTPKKSPHKPLRSLSLSQILAILSQFNLTEVRQYLRKTK